MYRNVVMSGIELSDHPDYSSAYLEYAEHENGTPLSESELDQLNESELRGELVQACWYDECVKLIDT